MRTWLIGALAVVVVAAGAFFVLRPEDRCEGNASTIYDGAVLPGGPQTADEALAGFLSVTDNDPTVTEFSRNVEDYVRREEAPGRVTFTDDDLVITVGLRTNGWFVGDMTLVCDGA